MKITILVCAASLFAAASATGQTAQDQQPPPSLGPGSTRFQVGVTGLIGFPVGEFGNNVDVSGGVTGDVGYRIGETPMSLGVGVGFLWYGSERRRVPLSLTIPDVLVDVTTSNYILLTHSRVRVQPRDGRLRPYVDGLVGFNYLFTQTRVDTGRDEFQDDTIARTTNLDDFAFSFGGGGGLMVDLASWPEGRLSLDLGMRYLRGSEADYLTEGSILRDDGLATLLVSRTRTDLVTILIGVAFEF